MMDWNFALRLVVVTIVGTFVVMGVLTGIIFLVSALMGMKQKQKKADT